jgi:hypothetical protein
LEGWRLPFSRRAGILKANKAATHVVFSDRLAYPGWDDVDSKDVQLEQLGSRLGPIRPLRYFGDKPPRMQLASLFLLSKLIRNLYPEALGYPDPLHRADLGAASFRERVKDVLRSSWLLERSNPLSHTFRAIREKLRR